MNKIVITVAAIGFGFSGLVNASGKGVTASCKKGGGLLTAYKALTPNAIIRLMARSQ